MRCPFDITRVSSSTFTHKKFYATIPRMTTHRSLNKLEFKAHMSIHNFTEVREDESHEAHLFTRDRFGKKHALSSEDGSCWVGGVKKALALILFVSTFSGPLFADSGEVRKAPHTNIQISSSDLEAYSIEDKLNRMPHSKEEKAVIYREGNSSLGFNEDGDPALTTNF